MKTTTITLFAAASLLSAAAFAQIPPTVPATPAVPAVPAVPGAPAAPAVPAVPGAPSERGDKPPKVPITFLGVETSELPNVVAEHLGLPRGFGLVVDYVVPDGPAAAAGLQANDIIKMLNDQILTEREQLTKLIRSFPEGTSITLTVLRKGAETKLTARLGKREVPQRRGDKHWHHGHNAGVLGPDMNKLTEELGKLQFGGVDGEKISADVRRAQREAQREAREAQRQAREAGREARERAREAARDARRAARDFRFSFRDDGALKTTKIDMAKAQIVYHDAQGELKIENVDGKKVLTAKDPQGRTVFSGPVGTPEELAKLPADVRQRYDKLEQKDLPAVTPAISGQEQSAEAREDGDDDDDDDDDSDDDAVDVLQISGAEAKGFPYRRLGINTILI